jgi:hypothetical protein
MAPRSPAIAATTSRTSGSAATRRQYASTTRRSLSCVPT